MKKLNNNQGVNCYQDILSFVININVMITVYLEKLVNVYMYDRHFNSYVCHNRSSTDTELTAPLIGTTYPDNL